MKKNLKIKYTLALLSALVFLISSITQASASTSNSTNPINPTSAPSFANNKSMNFLKNVVGLDIDRYEITLISSKVRDYTTDDNPIGKLGYIQTNEVYELINWDTKTEVYSDLRVSFSYVNSTLRSCSLKVDSGIAYSNKPLSADTSEAASIFLDSYNNFSKDNELNTMKSMLTTVNLNANESKTTDNLRIEIRTASDITSICWVRTQNGVDYSQLVLEYINGTFLDFFDSRSYITIGSSKVNIAKEEAISMALKQADGFSYNYNGTKVGNLTIVKDKIQAELKANVRFNPSEYYPCWVIDLPLNEVYPGSIYYIEVMVWADDGQVISCKTMGYGGPEPSSYSSDTEQSETLPTNPSNTINARQNEVIRDNLTIILATVILATLLSVKQPLKSPN